MFGIEFVLIFTGLVFTSASRAAVFLYTAPFFVALGSYQFLGERLSVAAMGRPGPELCRASRSRSACRRPNVDAKVLLGDLLVVAGGALWAATTLIAKGTRAAQRRAGKGARLSGRDIDPDPGLSHRGCSAKTSPTFPSALSISLLAYQAIWVVGCTFVMWFALVKTYSPSKLSSFTFITPLFGVVAAYFILHDTLTIAFGAAALLVIAGLYLVNKPDPKVTPDPNVPA